VTAGPIAGSVLVVRGSGSLGSWRTFQIKSGPAEKVRSPTMNAGQGWGEEVGHSRYDCRHFVGLNPTQTGALAVYHQTRNTMAGVKRYQGTYGKYRGGRRPYRHRDKVRRPDQMDQKGRR